MTSDGPSAWWGSCIKTWTVGEENRNMTTETQNTRFIETTTLVGGAWTSRHMSSCNTILSIDLSHVATAHMMHLHHSIDKHDRIDFVFCYVRSATVCGVGLPLAASLIRAYGVMGFMILRHVGLIHPGQFNGYAVECNNWRSKCSFTMSAIACASNGSSFKEGLRLKCYVDIHRQSHVH